MVDRLIEEKRGLPSFFISPKGSFIAARYNGKITDFC
jgi:hypothetical protein